MPHALMAAAQPFPWLVVMVWEVLEPLSTSKGLRRSPFSQMQSSALVTSPSLCSGMASTGLPREPAPWPVKKPSKTGGEKELHLHRANPSGDVLHTARVHGWEMACGCRKTCVYSGSTSWTLPGVFMLSHWVCLSLFGSGGPLPDSFVKPKPKSSLIPGPDMLYGSSDFYLFKQGNPRANVHLKMSFCPDCFFCPGSWLLHLWRRCSATDVSCAQTGRTHGA